MTWRNTLLAGIFIVFCAIYCSISLVNHYLFRSSALDLGMFNHALYNFSHFTKNYFTLDIGGAEVNYFGDHFSPITLLFTPFYFVFGSYTLLIIQILAILFGALGIYKYAQLHNRGVLIPYIILIQFFSIWGIYSALSFDFHNNVIAAMLLPWLVYFYEKQEKKKVLVFFILMLISKENMALWLVFIVSGLLAGQIHTTKDFNLKKYLKFEIPLILLSAAYFVIITGIVMPYLRNHEGFNQLQRYSHLGDSVASIFTNIVCHPKYIFSLLFENLSGNELYNGIKSELHFMVLVSGGYVLFYQPRFLIMLIPIYAQKLLTTDFGLWGINAQYSIEFTPVLSMALVNFIKNIKSNKIAVTTAVLTTLLTIFYNYRTIENRKSLWYNKNLTAFYDSGHYNTILNIKDVYSQLEKIPENAVVSTSSNLAPHLAFRKKIYHFPIVKDAEYIVLFKSPENYYPLNKETYDEQIAHLRMSEDTDIWVETMDLIIFKRKSTSNAQ